MTENRAHHMRIVIAHIVAAARGTQFPDVRIFGVRIPDARILGGRAREDYTLDNPPRDRLPAGLRDLSSRPPPRAASHRVACREPARARSKRPSPDLPRKSALSGCNSSHQA